MERKLRIAQYGCGKMSVYTMRYAMEKGAEIVCAFGQSPHTIGRDIGEIAGVGKTGVLVQDSKDAVAILKEKKPDACIITTASLMQVTCTRKITPSRRRESTKMKIGDSSDEKDIYGRANRRDSTWI